MLFQVRKIIISKFKIRTQNTIIILTKKFKMA